MAKKKPKPRPQPLTSGPTLQELLDAVAASNATVASTSTAVLDANSALISAQATFDDALAAVQNLVDNGGTLQQFQDASTVVLDANSALVTARAAYNTALTAAAAARAQLAADAAALVAFINQILAP
jgi:hypothetical protein